MYFRAKKHSADVVPFQPELAKVEPLAEVIELYPLAEIVKIPVSQPTQRSLGWWGELVPFVMDWPRNHGGGNAA